ncbi:hypothetical protein [Brevibacillus parabrevis]|uniref:hypothetical protein n=1 Tax=Brevibacillus parabrevis TaxID=54914 RepID=UPI000A4F5F7F|nr:hypothetical protein [Brevibacillus parabrevis]
MNFFLTLFSKYKCLVYTAFGHERYLQIAHKLSAHAVKFRTRSYSYGQSHLGADSAGMFPREDRIQYDIYVKKEDEHTDIWGFIPNEKNRGLGRNLPAALYEPICHSI